MSNETFEKKDKTQLVISKIKENSKILFLSFLVIILVIFGIFFLEKRKESKNIFISNEFNKAKILILSHVGRPKGMVIKGLSMLPICEYLQKKLSLKIRLIKTDIYLI